MTDAEWAAFKARQKPYEAPKGFDAWMQKVEAVIAAKTGLSSSDLDDYLYDDAYEDGATTKQAAMAALRNAGWGR